MELAACSVPQRTLAKQSGEWGRLPPLKIFAGLVLPARSVFHLETAAKLLISLESVLADFSKNALKSLNNQADFDSAIPRFESWRPSQ